MIAHRSGVYTKWAWRWVAATDCAGKSVQIGNTSDWRVWSKCYTDRKISTTDRLRTGAGFIDGGGTFTHMSKKTRASVDKYRERTVRWRTSTPPPPTVATAKKAGCTGQQYTDKHPIKNNKRYNWEVIQYFNSCDVSDVIDNTTWLSWACAAWIAVIPGAVGRGIGIGCYAWWHLYQDWWVRAQRRSTTDSVYTVSKYLTKENKDGRHAYDWYIYPQSP